VGCALFGVYAAILGGMGRIMGLSKKTNTGNKKNNIEVEIGGTGLAVFAVYLTIAVMQFFYDLIRLFVSRDREYRADAIAVRLTRDPLALAEALHIISRGWRGLGPIDRNIESIFIINPANNTMDEKEGFLADLFSTHPPIKKRIAALAALAHESIENVKKTAEASLTEDEAAAPEKSDYEPAWMVQGPDALWLGPFNVMQLAALGWLRPDTWIRPEGTDKLITAAEDVLLKPILERMFKGNKEHALECPRCKVGLVEEEYEGAMSFRCLFCGGMLTDETMLQRFLIRREKKFSPRIMKLAEQTQKDGIGMLRAKQALQSDLKCPACANPMIRSFQTPAYLVQTDKCVPCKLVWFDKDELEIFQYLVENKKSAVI
jgi:Zn-finger nucleic acid-binding protein